MLSSIFSRLQINLSPYANLCEITTGDSQAETKIIARPAEMSEASNTCGTRISPMELESLQPMQIRQSASNSRKRRVSGRIHPIDDFLIMVRLHIEYYPRLSCTVGIIFVAFALYFLIAEVRKPVTRNRLSHDYTKIDLHYNWKASQIDHWCLWVSL
jgi:hypothetical protein